MFLYAWSPTASANQTVDTQAYWPEGQLAATINDSARGMMARIAAYLTVLGGAGTSGGTGNAYTLASPPGHAATAYRAGMLVTFAPPATNTGAATLALDGLSAQPIVDTSGAPLVAGDLLSGARYVLAYDGAAWRVVSALGSGRPLPPSMPRGHLFGLTLSNNATDPTNDIDIAPGECRDSAHTADMVLAATLTKRLDAAWAVGTGNGGLDTGSIANTTYHIHLIRNPTSGVVDAVFSASPTSPTLPSGYTQFRRIGSIMRASGVIRPFLQDGDRFMWTTALGAGDWYGNSQARSDTLRAVRVPTGIQVQALVQMTFYAAATLTERVVLSDLSAPAPQASQTNSIVASLTNGQAFTFPPIAVRTNTSGQIRSRNEEGSANSWTGGETLGYIDTRGRLA